MVHLGPRTERLKVNDGEKWSSIPKCVHSYFILLLKSQSFSVVVTPYCVVELKHPEMSVSHFGLKLFKAWRKTAASGSVLG